MKGIILSGGLGTRLYPLTKIVSKQLLPIYDKPMIYYPLSVLMLAGITEILIISTPRDINMFSDLLGDGSKLGINLSYKIQDEPNGLAEAFIIGEDFIGSDNVSLILGDNIFFGHGLPEILYRAIDQANNGLATIFGYHVKDPQRYGVAEFDKSGKVLSIEEKPNNPKSNYAIVGLYFYPNKVIDLAKKIKPSARGELEITSLNEAFLQEGKLKVNLFGRGYAWLDTGTHESLLEASKFVETIESRQGLKIACIEEIAYENGFIGKSAFIELSENYSSGQYANYLKKIAIKLNDL